MSIARLSVSWKAGAKVAHITIQSKYIYHFFACFLELICNSLIDKDVVEHIFKKERGRAQDTTHNYIMRVRKTKECEALKKGLRIHEMKKGLKKKRYIYWLDEAFILFPSEQTTEESPYAFLF